MRHDQGHHYALLHLSARGTLTVEVFAVAGDGTPKRLLDTFALESTR